MEHRQTPHAALPRPTHDESARQDFVASLRQYNMRTVGAGNHAIYKARVEPAFVKEHGRPPASASEVRPLMTTDPYYQFWSATQRNSQEMMWDSVIDTVERTLPEIRANATLPKQLGSLTLNPELPMPGYHTAYDIHLQPGGYHSDQTADDISAGAIYDLGVPVYSLGMMGRENNCTGDTLVNFYQRQYPDRSPERVLDVGCAIGNSTVPWARAYPQAEVHGIDVGAPCLRYGHARANALGASIHLSQQNAEFMDFPDAYFDVVASALVFHETSRTAVGRIFAEIYRVLKPSGVMIHFDGFKSSSTVEPIAEFLGMWEVYNNNENFLQGLKTIDVLELNRQVGFSDVRFEKTAFATDLPPTTPGGKGYLVNRFDHVTVLVAEK